MLQAHLGALEEREIEVAAVIVAVTVKVVHADADPRRHSAAAARGGGLGEPVDLCVQEILIQVHERHDTIDELFFAGAISDALANRVAAEILAVAAPVAVENGWDRLRRIPRARGVGVNDEGVDAAVGEEIDIPMDP